MVKSKEVRFIRVPGPAIIENEIKNLENTVHRYHRLIEEIKNIKKNKKDVRAKINKEIKGILSNTERIIEHMPEVNLRSKRATKTKSQKKTMSSKKKVAKKEPAVKKQRLKKKERKSNISNLRKELEALQKELK